MAQIDLSQSEQLLIDQLPLDGSAVGNNMLTQRWVSAMLAAGQPADEAAFQATRNRLLEAGLISRGKGRGGSTFRTAVSAPDAGVFELGTSAPSKPAEAKPKKGTSNATAKRKPAAQSAGDSAQVLSYRHTDKRKNNPEVGLVNEESDPQQPKKEWAYNPHLDPVLNFASSRAELENLVVDALNEGIDHEEQQRGEILAWLDHALAGSDEATMREVIANLRERLAKQKAERPERKALEEIQRRGAPYLQWAGKAERTSFEVDTVSLHVHERIDPMSILSAVRKNAGGGSGDKNAKPADQAKRRQASLFEAPFENLPLRDAVDFYRHDKGWANRLVSGDSLQVMNSLLVKEGMAGQVQMVYIDPPYGIKYGSNFQPFVGKRDVKDKSDADLTQEPEMIKAFRDTWELGLHSYLTYLRDRLLLAKELLQQTGSVFVQISDENLHHAYEVIAEVFGAENFVSVITVRKTGAVSSPDAKLNSLGTIGDFIVWFAKSKAEMKYCQLFLDKEDSGAAASQYRLSDVAGSYQSVSIESNGYAEAFHFPILVDGIEYRPAATRHWSTTRTGIERAISAGRVLRTPGKLRFKKYLADFPVSPVANIWTDLMGAAGLVYVVQTNDRIVERCMLMTTSPGDLVLDPTCGSGTTAVVAEKWGRRWITCDTSRVAVTLAKQRLTTASFDYYELAYPHEGLKGGFIYKTVPHVTLKSIANNADIDAIYERLHPAIEDALAALNAAFAKHPPKDPLPVAEGVRKGQKLTLGQPGVALHEWEVPLPGDEGALPAGWPAELGKPFEAFHAARQHMQAEMDRSIAANAENETLYDQPEKSKTKLRITGPFTVEAVPFPTVLSLEAAEGGASATPTEDQAYQTSIARSGESNRQQQWRDELLKTGIRGKGGQKLEFTELEVMAGTTCLHATGTLADTGERVVVSFGPEHGALEQRQVEHALNEAGELFPRPKMIVFCAFTFDPEAAKDIDALKGITALKAQMNTDLLTEDLKKARSSNQSFWLMGQPDVALTQTADGLWQVEVNGFDYFDTVKGELISGGKGKIAMWSLDTDYDGRSLFPHQVFFPMAGKDEGWKKLKKTIRAELDESLLDQFHGTVSLPFEAGKHGKAAVKIVDDRGIESLKILPLAKGEA